MANSLYCYIRQKWRNVAGGYERILPEKPVYGVSLKKHLSACKRTIALPISCCCKKLSKKEILEPGLFTCEVGNPNWNDLCKYLEEQDDTILDKDYDNNPWIVAEALLHYLYSLPEGITNNNIFVDVNDEDWHIMKLRIKRLPTCYRLNLTHGALIDQLTKEFVIKFFANYMKYAELDQPVYHNHIENSELLHEEKTIFLLRIGKGIFVNLRDSNQSNRICRITRNLLLNYKQIFNPTWHKRLLKDIKKKIVNAF